MTDDSVLGRRRRAAAEIGDVEFLQRKAAIIAAAAAMFTEDGYDRTTFAGIGRRVGLDRSTVYYYFSSKESLLQEVLHEIIGGNLSRIRAIAAGPGTATEKLRSAVRETMESYARNYPHQYIYARADIERLRATGDAQTIEILDLSAAYVDELVAIVREGQGTGEFDDYADAQLLGMGIIGMVNWTFRWYRPGGDFTAADIAEAFGEMAVRGVLAGAGAPPTSPKGTTAVEPAHRGRPRS